MIDLIWLVYEWVDGWMEGIFPSHFGLRFPSLFSFFFFWTCPPLAVGIELAKPRLKYHDTPTYCVTSRTERDSYRFFPPSPRQSIEQPLVIVASRPRLVRTLMSSPNAGADPVVPSRCGAGRLPCAAALVFWNHS